MMEVQALLIGLAVVIISAIIIYIISVLTMQETTYDEVIAEQRKQQDMLWVGKPSKTEKEKPKKKKPKKPKTDKSPSKDDKTETAESGIEAETEPEEPKMLQLEIDPEIIEPTQYGTIETEPKHKGKGRSGEKKKSILINKEEQPLVDESVDTEKQFIHFRATPKDMVELERAKKRQTHEEEEAAVVVDKPQDPPQPSAKEQRKREKQQRARQEAEERMRAEVVAVQEAAAAATAAAAAAAPQQQMETGKKRNKKSANTAGGDAGTTLNEGAEVLRLMEKTRLTDQQVASLMEVVQSRYSPVVSANIQWTGAKKGKADGLALTNKQLEEKTSQLHEQQALLQSSNQKLKDLRQELNHQQQQAKLMQEKNQEKIGVQSAEIKALHDRMQESHVQHSAETNTLRMQLDQLKGSRAHGAADPNQAALIQQLRQENQQLKEAANQSRAMPAVDISNLQQQLKIMNDELSKNVMRLTQTENAKKSLETKITKKKKVPTATPR